LREKIAKIDDALKRLREVTAKADYTTKVPVEVQENNKEKVVLLLIVNLFISSHSFV
jgi:hypothetical protein